MYKWKMMIVSGLVALFSLGLGADGEDEAGRPCLSQV